MLSDNRKIRLVALQGSVRPNNYTAKALAIVKQFADRQLHVDLEIIDPTHLELPLPGKGTSDDALRIQQAVKDADAIILATPEYHGSFSSVTKLIVENLGFPSVLKGKPVALLGVASGQIGAIKALEHLRSVVSHVGAIVLPGPVSISGVRTKFDEAGNITDERTESRIGQLVDNLVDYAVSRTCPNKTLEALVRENSTG